MYVDAYIKKINIVPDLQCLKNIYLDKKSIIRTLISECFNNYMFVYKDEEMIELYNFCHKKII